MCSFLYTRYSIVARAWPGGEQMYLAYNDRACTLSFFLYNYHIFYSFNYHFITTSTVAAELYIHFLINLSNRNIILRDVSFCSCTAFLMERTLTAFNPTQF